VKILLEELKEQMIEFELDTDFSGDSHKFGSPSAWGVTPYRDLEYDFSGVKGQRLKKIQLQLYKVLPHVPSKATKNFDIFLMFLMQMYVKFMSPKDRYWCTCIVAMLDLGIPLLNHLGRSKQIKFLTSFLMAFNREVYQKWRNTPNCYPNQWPPLYELPWNFTRELFVAKYWGVNADTSEPLRDPTESFTW